MSFNSNMNKNTITLSLSTGVDDDDRVPPIWTGTMEEGLRPLHRGGPTWSCLFHLPLLRSICGGGICVESAVLLLLRNLRVYLRYSAQIPERGSQSRETAFEVIRDLWRMISIEVSEQHEGHSPDQIKTYILSQMRSVDEQRAEGYLRENWVRMNPDGGAEDLHRFNDIIPILEDILTRPSPNREGEGEEEEEE